mmetsp:Transcript_2916/g.6377  ORF Transcript_2916/g.6377 Transcript_2916/m.6377 type:complete len:232 (+) Transcript_2916:1561-2256(+)
MCLGLSFASQPVSLVARCLRFLPCLLRQLRLHLCCLLCLHCGRGLAYSCRQLRVQRIQLSVARLRRHFAVQSCLRLGKSLLRRCRILLSLRQRHSRIRCLLLCSLGSRCLVRSSALCLACSLLQPHHLLGQPHALIHAFLQQPLHVIVRLLHIIIGPAHVLTAATMAAAGPPSSPPMLVLIMGCSPTQCSSCHQRGTAAGGCGCLPRAARWKRRVFSSAVAGLALAGLCAP